MIEPQANKWFDDSILDDFKSDHDTDSEIGAPLNAGSVQSDKSKLFFLFQCLKSSNAEKIDFAAAGRSIGIDCVTAANMFDDIAVEMEALETEGGLLRDDDHTIGINQMLPTASGSQRSNNVDTPGPSGDTGLRYGNEPDVSKEKTHS